MSTEGLAPAAHGLGCGLTACDVGGNVRATMDLRPLAIRAIEHALRGIRA